MTLEELEEREAYYDSIIRERDLMPDEIDDYLFMKQEEARAVAAIKEGLARIVREAKAGRLRSEIEAANRAYRTARRANYK